ncbi:AzlC family ABC transporter permease [Lactobacillus sp. wkB10]|uniref:AzlC family ABC transporter permease n=1 Tax=Lactobacillus sp. wkB10 TaxID=1545701 RepID=UPI0005145036|nr:AzlC family ABC transporter permease [Lactobacillus sp. wkB10]KGG54120.1 hypothetical protein LACWKB10_1040 [Lactobacillus sp. wkB10]
MDTYLTKKSAIKESIPTIFGYIGISTAFGIIGKASGFSTLEVCLMSILIYAGSVQLTTLNMLVAGSPIASIVLAAFLVNSRVILMSTTVAGYLKQENLKRNILIGTFLTDESFALGMNKINYTNDKLNFTWFNTVNIVSYITWQVGTLLGAVLGNFITDPKKLGLDFAIVAMFIGLLYLQVIGDKKLNKVLQIIVILISFALTYLLTIILPANLVVIVVTLIGCSLGMVIKHVFF